MDLGRYVLFMRGINVGGFTLRIEHLRNILKSVGLKNIKTYIQSGNAISDSEKTNICSL